MPKITNPRQVILVTSRANIPILGKEVVKDNIITLAWNMPVSFEPMLYAIAIGKTRFSCKLIQKSKAFVVNFVSPELEKQALYCGSHSGDDTDKFKGAKLTKEEAKKLDCPRIKEAIGYFECKVINEVDAGDHIIFVGKIVNSELKKEGKRLIYKGNNEFTTTE